VRSVAKVAWSALYASGEKSLPRMSAVVLVAPSRARMLGNNIPN
jgi:hypothetical protein